MTTAEPAALRGPTVSAHVINSSTKRLADEENVLVADERREANDTVRFIGDNLPVIAPTPTRRQDPSFAEVTLMSAARVERSDANCVHPPNRPHDATKDTPTAGKSQGTAGATRAAVILFRLADSLLSCTKQIREVTHEICVRPSLEPFICTLGLRRRRVHKLIWQRRTQFDRRAGQWTDWRRPRQRRASTRQFHE